MVRNSKLSDTQEENGDAYVVVDGNGTVLHVNPAAEKLFGKKKDHFLGFPFDFPIPDHEAIIDIGVDGTRVEVEISAVPTNWRGRTATRLSIRDLSGRKEAEDALRANAAILSTVFNSSPIPIAVTGLADRHFINVNEAWQKRIGYSKLEAIGHTSMELNLFPDDTERQRLVELVRTGGKVQGLEVKVRQKSGEIANLLMSAVLIEVDGRSCILTMALDFTERKRAEDALKESNRKINTIVNNLRGVVYRCANDTEWTMQYISDGIFELSGYPAEEFVGNRVRSFNSIIEPSDRTAVWSGIQAALEARQHFTLEYRIHTAAGDTKWVWERGRGVFEDDALVALEGFVSDITERRRAEEAVRDSLREKDTLLKEIHHRVKNNLQVVSSLLSLQASIAGDPGLRVVLMESQNRVRSMALVHEQLYQSQNLAAIDFRKYLEHVSKLLMNSFGRQDVTCAIAADDIWMDIDRAIPCGLIVNELVTNALKHAFTDHQPGRVDLRIRKEGTDIVMVVEDNGSGMRPGVDFPSAKSMGATIVHTLVEQLEGTITVEQGAGTRFVVRFPQTKGETTNRRPVKVS